MHLKRSKRAPEVLVFLKAIRARYADGRRVHLVSDNLSTHKHRDVRGYCRSNNIRLVYTATNTSCMNRIECHFAPFRHFVLDNSD